jgi:uncharacterized membrane protein
MGLRNVPTPWSEDTMNIVAGVVSGLLAAAYLMAGILKTTRSKDALKPNMPWVEDFSPRTVKFIGTVELLGAIGLILPWLLEIAEVLTPLAAAGLALIQLLAIPVHVRRGEAAKALPINIVLLAAAVFVAVARFADL